MPNVANMFGSGLGLLSYYAFLICFWIVERLYFGSFASVFVLTLSMII